MKRLFLLISLLWLVACQPENAGQLPTQFEIPTENPTLMVSDTPEPTTAAVPTLSEITPPATTEVTQAAMVVTNVTAGPTSTLTFTPSLTITDTITRTPSPTPSETYQFTLLDILVLTADAFTPVPTGLISGGTANPFPATGFPTLPGNNVTTSCQYAPPGGFAAIYSSDSTLATGLGCPIGAPPNVSPQAVAMQVFEHGTMIWVSSPFEHIYVMFEDGTYLRYDDLFDPTVDPESGGEIPPANLVEPVRGFGKIWRTAPGVRERLGWATQQELAGTANVLNFERGSMISASLRSDIVVLVQQGGPVGGTWKAPVGRY